MESVCAIKDIRASRATNATLNTMNHFVMKTNYFAHIVIMLVMLADAIRLVPKAAVYANMVGQCNQNLVDVLILMNVQPFKILVLKTNFA